MDCDLRQDPEGQKLQIGSPGALYLSRVPFEYDSQIAADDSQSREEATGLRFNQRNSSF